jgi:hypothetical protein
VATTSKNARAHHMHGVCVSTEVCMTQLCPGAEGLHIGGGQRHISTCHDAACIQYTQCARQALLVCDTMFKPCPVMVGS